VLRHALLERGYKQCRDCGVVKPFSEYMKSSSCVGGCRPECKACANQFAARYREREDIHEKRLEYSRRAETRAYMREREQQPDYKAKKSAYDRRPERRAIKNAYQRSPEFKKHREEYNRKPEIKYRLMMLRLRRGERMASLPHTLTEQDWVRALEYFGNCCAVCGTPRRGQRVIAGDHWIPLSRGGPTTAENIVPPCHSLKGDIDGCNNTKRDRMPEVWLIERYGREKAREILKRIEAYFVWVKSQQ
jgi:hypothetical protein